VRQPIVVCHFSGVTRSNGIPAAVNANESKFPPLKLSISATVDLQAAKIETTVRFTTTYSSTISAELPDPNQPDIPGIADAIGKFKKSIPDGMSVTIETPSGKPASIKSPK